MERRVVLSKRAAGKLDKLLEYLETKWSKRVKDQFIQKMDRALNIIKEQPESSPISEKIQGLHRCVVTSQTTVYYKFDEKVIRIVTLFDTRQNPTKLNKETGG
jgi:plasmid stabilization system protein ParE